MTQPLMFLPQPRQMTTGAGTYSLPDARLILLDAPVPQALISAAGRLQDALKRRAGLRWEANASRAVPAAEVGVTLRVAPDRAPYPQGYRLHITPQGVLIEGHDPAGIFYGVCTLAQVIEQAGRELPLLEINDWPDFPARGVMLDISRDRVWTMDYLYDLVDRLAGWKVNQLQLYTEHTFAYRNHPTVWAKASPMTGEEILALDAYCRERFVELVPNQNSFGHMERWLTLPDYAALAETHEEFTPPWGGKAKGPYSVAPENPASLALFRGMYDELLPHFTSRLFNVGMDETWDLGAGASKAACEERGVGRVYLEYLLKIYADVKARGFTMQFWGDIINQHPELVAELPRDVIALEWGYEADHPFDRNGARYAAAGVPFYVCPGTSAWNSIVGRTDNALGNLRNAAENGLKNGAIGYLNTDWGDNGHWQIAPASYIGFAMGAAYSWAIEANRNADAAALTGRFAFEDQSGLMGQVAYDFGNLYKLPGLHTPNNSPLQLALQSRPERLRQFSIEPANLDKTLAALDAAEAQLDRVKMERPDADLIVREYRMVARLMRHALSRVRFVQHNQGQASALASDLGELIEEYRALWLERSRPGGLTESVARLENARADYSA